MLFTKLKLNYFGRFQNHEIELKPGINLIYGENEAGKSTVHTFIRGMLFGIERLRGRGAASKEDIYTRYLPWDYPGAYGGSMDIRLGDKEYRLQRSFHANDKSFIIMDLSTGREIRLKEDRIAELIPGLTESTYRNTISIEQQKSVTDTELAAQVRNYIANLSIAKSKEVNVAKAVSLLTEQRKQLESALNPAVIRALQADIEEGLVKEERLDELTLKLRELQNKEQSLATQKLLLQDSKDQEAERQMEQLPAILEKYRSFKEMDRQEKSLKLQEQELKEKLSQLEREQQAAVSLKEDIAEQKQLQKRLEALEKIDTELLQRKERLNRRTRVNACISILPGFLAAVIVAGLTGFRINSFLLLSVPLLAIGVFGFVLLSWVQVGKRKEYETEAAKAKQDRAEILIRMQRILQSYGVTGTEELNTRQEEVMRNSYAQEHGREQLKELKHRIRELEDSRDVIYDTIMRYALNFIAADVLTDSTIQELSEVITSRRHETAVQLDKINGELEDLRFHIGHLRGELTLLEGNEEELLKNKEKYLDLEQKQTENMTRLEAVKLALSSITELSADIHDSFGQQLNTAVTDIIREITDRRYQDLKVDEKLEVKVGRNGDYVQLERLSAGTIDQIYFALRMTVADLLLGKDEVPLIFDDSFALYDDTRVKVALKELSARKQILLFTCHKREQQLLSELGITYHLTELPRV